MPEDTLPARALREIREFLPGLLETAADAGHRLAVLLETAGILVAFDWQAWIAERPEGWTTDAAVLRQAGIGRIRRLLTVHARRDRFEEGHLRLLLRTGYLRQALQRLLELHGGRIRRDGGS
jgi:Family of unknown function (DUF6508)